MLSYSSVRDPLFALGARWRAPLEALRAFSRLRLSCLRGFSSEGRQVEQRVAAGGSGCLGARELTVGEEDNVFDPHRVALRVSKASFMAG